MGSGSAVASTDSLSSGSETKAFCTSIWLAKAVRNFPKSCAGQERLADDATCLVSTTEGGVAWQAVASNAINNNGIFPHDGFIRMHSLRISLNPYGQAASGVVDVAVGIGRVAFLQARLNSSI